MNKLKSLLEIFLTMMKVGLFTFGGGYAMIAILEDVLINQKKWMDKTEFIDMVAISESTPGPIAINCATYIGYKKNKVLGAIIATVGVVLPSFVIIFLVSLFFDQFLENVYVYNAFRGIQVCVVFLILRAGLKLYKDIKKKFWDLLILFLTIVCMITLSLHSLKFSSIFYIMISGFLGFAIYLINRRKDAR